MSILVNQFTTYDKRLLDSNHWFVPGLSELLQYELAATKAWRRLIKWQPHPPSLFEQSAATIVELLPAHLAVNQQGLRIQTILNAWPKSFENSVNSQLSEYCWQQGAGELVAQDNRWLLIDGEPLPLNWPGSCRQLGSQLTDLLSEPNSRTWWSLINQSQLMIANDQSVSDLTSPSVINSVFPVVRFQWTQPVATLLMFERAWMEQRADALELVFDSGWAYLSQAIKRQPDFCVYDETSFWRPSWLQRQRLRWS